jgi:primosomal protein N'
MASSVSPVAEVLCDDTGRVGPLSYLVPESLSVHVGDAVRVPFGASERYGVVVGAGDATKATREVSEVFGPRTGPGEIALAERLAEENFVAFSTIAPRLAPRSKRGNAPLVVDPVDLVAGPGLVELGHPDLDRDVTRRLLAAAPGVSRVRLAALEAARLAADGGQVLVLCPTKKHVSAVCAQFVAGAARLDVVPKKDAPSPWRAFVEGALPVAVSTRAAALWSAPKLCGIVVLDESHPGHVESAQPHTNARDVAVARASDTLAVSLITTVPTAQALGSKVKLVAVGTRDHWPAVHLVARRDLPRSERLFPPALTAAAAKARSGGPPVLVVAPAASSRWRCRGCRMVLAVPADTSSAPPCGRCGGLAAESGWSPERIMRTLPNVSAVSVAELLCSRPRPGATVVLFDVDALSSAAELHPSQLAAQVAHHAAQVAGPSGTVLVLAEGGPPDAVVDVLVRRDVRRHAKRVWAHARANALPPFTKTVTIHVARSSPPRPPSSLPGRVLGPRRLDSGEFEVVVLCAPHELSAVGRYVASLRRAGRCRVTVA